MKTWMRGAASATAAGLLWAAGAAAQEGTQMAVAELGAGMYRIEAEIANTFQTRQIGLMNRSVMALHRGMVFVFPAEATHCMWMKNTFLPLSVAFVDAKGRIINIEDMEPLSEDSHCARAPARFALEMNRGWFAERGIRAGEVLRGFERLPPPQ